MLENKLSKNISSCTRLIARQAARAYAKIPVEHRRWIDLEDVKQEGYIAALEAEKEFKPQGAKYSTFLYNALTFRFNHEFLGKFRQQKRQAQLIELDAERGAATVARIQSKRKFFFASDTADATIEVPEENETMFPGSDQDSVDSFINLCRGLSPKAIVWFVGSIMSTSYDWKERVVPMNGERYDVWAKEVHDAVATQTAIRPEIDHIINSQRAQKMALISLAQNSSIGLGTEMDARVLECISCQGRFALAAIRAGRYIVATMTCLSCYQKMQLADPDDSCFGKPKTAVHEGYSEHDIECSLHCKDKTVCRQFVDERMLMKEKKSKKAAAEETESKTTTAVAEEEEATPVKKAKKGDVVAVKAKVKKVVVEVEPEDDEEEEEEVAAPAKKAKAGKVAKIETIAKKGKAETNGDYAAPKEVVRWPHKKDSWMQYCFQMAYRGVKAAELEKLTEEANRKWPIFLKVLRGGRSGMKRPTHSWTLDESGGRLKITDVKYLGGAE